MYFSLWSFFYISLSIDKSTAMLVSVNCRKFTEDRIFVNNGNFATIH